MVRRGGQEETGAALKGRRRRLAPASALPWASRPTRLRLARVRDTRTTRGHARGRTLGSEGCVVGAHARESSCFFFCESARVRASASAPQLGCTRNARRRPARFVTYTPAPSLTIHPPPLSLLHQGRHHHCRRPARFVTYTPAPSLTIHPPPLSLLHQGRHHHCRRQQGRRQGGIQDGGRGFQRGHRPAPARARAATALRMRAPTVWRSRDLMPSTTTHDAASTPAVLTTWRRT